MEHSYIRAFQHWKPPAWMLYWNIYSIFYLWPCRITREYRHQYRNIAVSKQTEILRHWSQKEVSEGELDWIIMYYFFPDILKTCILNLYHTPEHSAAEPESLQFQRERKKREKKIKNKIKQKSPPHLFPWGEKTLSLLMQFSAGTIPWADSLQGQTTASSTQVQAGVCDQGGRGRWQPHHPPPFCSTQPLDQLAVLPWEALGNTEDGSEHRIHWITAASALGTTPPGQTTTSCIQYLRTRSQ